MTLWAMPYQGVRVRIEGSHEVVELVPGGRLADPRPDTEPDEPTTRLSEWWRAGPPLDWRVRAKERLAGSRAVRPIVRAVERTPHPTRVVIALVAIAAAGFLALGLGARFVLHDYVMGQAEARLETTTEQLEPTLHSRAFYYFIRPMPDGIWAQRRSADGEIREFRGFNDDLMVASGPDLPSQLPAAGDRSFTVPDRGGDGQWLVRVATSPGSEYSLVVATEIGAGFQAIGRLIEVALVIGGLALAAMAYIGFRAARSSASTLTEMEKTVEAAVAGDLSRRVPEPVSDSEPGQVARAVNTLIEQIDDARRAEEHTRRTVGEAGLAMRQPLNVIQGFTAFYRERPGHDPERMARMIDRVGDEAARIEMAIDDLVSDMSQVNNGGNGRSR
jgi:two-component system, OmpR family, sensor kinase